MLGGASVGPRVPASQVRQHQDHSIGELPRFQVMDVPGRSAGFTCVIQLSPWQRCVQVLICRTGEVKVPALPGRLQLVYTEALWDVCGKRSKAWWGEFTELLFDGKKPSQFLVMTPDTSGADSSTFLTFDDNVEWLLWAKTASGIQWKGFLFTLAIWNFPWKRPESFLMADSVYLYRTPQGLPK